MKYETRGNRAKRLITILTMLLTAVVVSANPISKAQARQKAEAFLRMWDFHYKPQESPMKTRMSLSTTGNLVKKHQFPLPIPSPGNGLDPLG